MPTFYALGSQHRQVLDRLTSGGDDESVVAFRARVDALDEVVGASGRALAGDLRAGRWLREQLLTAVGATAAEFVSRLAGRVLVGDGGTLDPRFRLRRRYTGPQGELTAAQAALVAAAVRVAEDPAEALAFALVAGQAVDDLTAAATTVLALRDGRTAPGDLVLPGSPQGPLRPPPDLVDDPLGGSLGGSLGGPRGGGPRGPDWHQMDRWITQVADLRSTWCVAVLAQLVADVPRMAEQYTIDHVVGDDGCAGNPIELRGSGFGDVAGRVRFEASTGGTVSVRAEHWSSTRLLLRVPPAAVGGPVGLLLPLRTVTACGRSVEIFRAGRDGSFHGGTAQVVTLTVGGRSTPGTVRHDVPVAVRFRTLPAPRADGTGGALVDLLVRKTPRIRSPAVDLISTTVPAGEGRVDVDLTSDRAACDLTVVVRARSRCGPEVERQVDVVVAAPLDLVADPVELTQVVQIVSPANGPVHNAVALVEGARTLARVHLRAVHHDFDWGRGPGVLPVAGTVTVEQVATGARTSYPVAGATSAPGRGRDARVRPAAGCALEVPYPLVVAGGLGIRADLRADAGALGLPAPAPLLRTEGSAAVTPSRSRRVLLLRAAVPRRLGLATPTVTESLDLVRAATARLPVGVDAWDVYLHGLTQVVLADAAITSTDAQRARGAWDDLLEDARDTADDLGTPDGTLVLVVAPASDSPVAGVGGDWFAAAQADSPGTMAHEIAHAVGVGHAGCRPIGGLHGVPDGVDPTLPTHTEVTGIDLHGTVAAPGPHVVPAGTQDLMGYCAPSWAAGDPVWGRTPGQARLPSVVLYERLRRLL